jgi:hypothetical protein
VVSVEEANNIYLEVLLEPHNITLCSMKYLMMEMVNYNLMINAVVPPLEYPNQ